MSLKQRLIKVGASLLIVLLAVAAVMLIIAPRSAQAQLGQPPRRSAAPDSPAAFIDVYVDSSSNSSLTTCSSAPNDCTLRGAIDKANADPGNIYTIYFTPTVTLIALLSPLPTINTANQLWIVGNSGVPRIDAIFMSNGDVFSINDNNVKISGLSIVNGHTIADGIYADIHVLTGTRNLIENNYLGTLRAADVHGGTTSCTPNPDGGSLVSRNSIYGVWIDAGASGSSGAGNGAAYLYGNTIGCHDFYGVVISGADYVYIGESSTGVSNGNYIGLNTTSVPLTNTFDGILLTPFGSNAPRYATIANNHIASNGRYGIWLHGNGTANSSGTTGTVIKNNTIGIDGSGLPRGNGSDGIFIDNNAFQDFIGGSSDADRNIISGNSGHGVWVNNSVGIGVLGNYIGTNVNGTAALANALSGVTFDSGSANIVGGAIYGFFPATKANLIEYNTGDGVQLINSTHDNIVLANTLRYNTLSGVAIFGGAYDNLVGGDVITSLNLIGNNGTYGVYLAGSTTTGNTVRYNDILNNAIDGVTLQDDAHDNTIGGDVPQSFNLVRYNAGSGIYILDSGPNTISYNGIIGNAFYGVILDGSSTAGTLITGTAISQNGYDGIGERNSANFNVWSHVSIYDNGGLGIDKNASSDSTNIVNPPTAVITSVLKSGGQTVVRGTGLNGTLIELYGVAPDSSGFGEGKTYAGTATVSSGKWVITDTLNLGCYTLFENALGIAASEFGANSCRTFLPLVLKN